MKGKFGLLAHIFTDEPFLHMNSIISRESGGNIFHSFLNTQHQKHGKQKNSSSICRFSTPTKHGIPNSMAFALPSTAFQFLMGESWSGSSAGKRYNVSSEFWVYPEVSSHLDMPGKPFKGGHPDQMPRPPQIHYSIGPTQWGTIN